MARQFDALLRGLSLKVTPKRLAILEILAAEPIYLTPEEVWKRMKRTFTKGRPSHGVPEPGGAISVRRVDQDRTSGSEALLLLLPE